MEKTCTFLKQAGTYYLATVDGDQPRVRPFGTAHIFENRLYIQTGRNKDVSRQIEVNPKCEICAFHKGTWVRITAQLVDDPRMEAKKSLLDAYPGLRKMYDENDDHTQVLYLKDATAVFYSFNEEPEVHTF